MDFHILGPLEVRDDRGEVSIGGGKQRALLALLLIHPNESLATDRLIDELWGEEPPTTAAKIIQNHVSQLRRVLGNDRLQTLARGYALRVGPGELDVDRFRQRLADGRTAQAAGDPERASLLLREALAMWRGPPLAEFTYEAFAGHEIGRLEELRLSALIERIDVDLALGRHLDLVGELETLVAHHPLQERLRGQLMLALYRCGRQAEAVQVYQDARRTLAEELGIEPGQALQRLEQSILTHDPAIEQPASEQSRSAAGVRSRSRRWLAVLRSQRLLVVVLASAAAVAASAAAVFAWSDHSAPAATITGNAVAIIDPASNRVTGQVAVGVAPGALAVGNGEPLGREHRRSERVAHRPREQQGRHATSRSGVSRSVLRSAVTRSGSFVRRPDGYPELIKIDPRFDVVGPSRRRWCSGDPSAPRKRRRRPGRRSGWRPRKGCSSVSILRERRSRRASTRATAPPASRSARARCGRATRSATTSPASIRPGTS